MGNNFVSRLQHFSPGAHVHLGFAVILMVNIDVYYVYHVWHVHLVIAVILIVTIDFEARPMYTKWFLMIDIDMKLGAHVRLVIVLAVVDI